MVERFAQALMECRRVLGGGGHGAVGEASQAGCWKSSEGEKQDRGNQRWFSSALGSGGPS